MNWSDWHGCYEGSWKGVIAGEAFAHPAKFARGLIERIVRHGLSSGYWRPGELVGDPFGGVGLGGLVSASHGLRWIGCELEPRFVELAKQNFALHRATWESMGDPLPVIVQGDSRKFAELVGAVVGAVTSPPYAESVKGDHGERETAQESRDKRQTPGGSLGQSARHGGYGATEGQIGALAEGKLDGAVTSPPFSESVNRPGEWNHSLDPRKSAYPQNRSQSYVDKNRETERYGDSDGQLGRVSGETYWRAMREVYSQMRLAMKPGAVAAIVIKDYVKDGKRVRLCDDTCRLLEACGFTVFERTRCWLVKVEKHPSLFGGEVEKRTERKSFFRRLHEKKLAIDDERRIDWEEVIWCSR